MSLKISLIIFFHEVFFTAAFCSFSFEICSIKCPIPCALSLPIYRQTSSLAPRICPEGARGGSGEFGQVRQLGGCSVPQRVRASSSAPAASVWRAASSAISSPTVPTRPMCSQAVDSPVRRASLSAGRWQHLCDARWQHGVIHSTRMLPRCTHRQRPGTTHAAGVSA